ncbi:hypothetical protein QWY75_12940 [Pontixanthobacter aestiaquae]|uniref:Uncharacterized protein n=1 Tax=Pontixanthobacter aestiaquae TaxID=1509367 RepID=A0A844Z550_9SPHN|nr:hypothetical protein [Pontixanthobacter aestiaquae]MDN3647111.1 hypothetical protein [Pontixanthobacter aestiaquae]MXO81913.1 hypothetical protein [Pontixanthobacter aestiaquae]
MGSFISRNSLASLFFLGLIMFGISQLVGSEGEDGLLMRITKDFTGEAEKTPAKANPAPVAAPVQTAPDVAEPDAGFFEDSDLIDRAEGFNPAPTLDPGSGNNATDESILLPPEALPQPVGPAPRRLSNAPLTAGPSGPPTAGMVVGDGINIVPGGDDEEE